MLDDSSAFETRAHAILSVARVTEENLKGCVNKKVTGTAKMLELV